MMPDVGTRKDIGIPHSKFHFRLDHIMNENGEQIAVLHIACSGCAFVPIYVSRQLYLVFVSSTENVVDSDAGTTQCDLYVKPSDSTPVAKAATHVKLFALHTCSPYVRRCRSLDTHTVCLPWSGRGMADYMSSLCTQLYPDGYNGPFTIGVWWQ